MTLLLPDFTAIVLPFSGLPPSARCCAPVDFPQGHTRTCECGRREVEATRDEPGTARPRATRAVNRLRRFRQLAGSGAESSPSLAVDTRTSPPLWFAMPSRYSAVEVKPGVSRSVVHTDHLMVAIIDFTDGPWAEPEPFHSHPHEQISYVAEGEILFYCEQEPPQTLKVGDVFAVESGKKHAVRLLSARARLVDSFSPIRQDFLPRP